MKHETHRRYLKVVLLACKGLTTKEIGARLNKSLASVEHTIIKLRDYYGAKNLCHLISILYLRKIIKR